jgi:uridine kinase
LKTEEDIKVSAQKEMNQTRLSPIKDKTEVPDFLTPNRLELAALSPLVKRIGALPYKWPIILGVAGGTGSGKTTLATAIFESLGEENVTYISHDCYYHDLSHLPMSEREQANFDHPDSLDTALLISHLNDLKAGISVSIPTYDYGSHSRKQGMQKAASKPIILVEGILIFTDPELCNLLDIKIFVDTEDDIRLIRRIQRDTVERLRTVDSVIKQYLKTVRPMHREYVEPSKRNADIIVPTGLNSVALDLVVSKLLYALSDLSPKSNM